MKKNKIVYKMYLLGFLLFSTLNVNCDDNKIVNPRRLAKDREYPFLCFIKRYIKQTNETSGGKWRIECSGTLLSLKHILTTARCVEKTGFKLKKGRFRFNPEGVSSFRVIAGTINADETGRGVQKREVERIIVPNTVVREEKQHYTEDIAIVDVKGDFTATLHVLAAPFMKLSEQFPDDESAYCPYTFKVCAVPGWGHQKSKVKEKHIVYSSDPSNELNVAAVTLLKLDECQSRICGLYQKIKTNDNPCRHIFNFSWSTVFCGMAVSETDVCYFDQGSPIVCEGSVIGMMTFVDQYFGCGRGAPAGYVSLRSVLKFIKASFPKSDGSKAVAAFWMMALDLCVLIFST